MSVVTAFMPQSHELRYYLHWPLLLMMVVAALVPAAKLPPRAYVAIVCAYVAALLAHQLVASPPPLVRAKRLLGQPVRAPRQARQLVFRAQVRAPGPQLHRVSAQAAGVGEAQLHTILRVGGR